MKFARTILAGLLLAAAMTGAAAAGPKVATVPSADGVPIRYEVDGSGAPALVFIHCWCCDRSYWSGQTSHFAKTHTVVTLDLAGHGESGLGREAWTIESFARDVVAVVDALRLERVILVGHSMGGSVALEAARSLSGRVVGIVGVDNFQDLSQKFAPEQRAGFLAQFEGDFAAMTERFVRGMFPAGADSALVAAVAADMASAPPEVGVGAMGSLLAYDAAPALAEIAAPIRNINADRWPTNVDGNRKLCRDYDANIVQGCGHFLHLEDPARFNELLGETIYGMTTKED
jgi:pimeloyl-ACP methyl ester carboxylesterase